MWRKWLNIVLHWLEPAGWFGVMVTGAWFFAKIVFFSKQPLPDAMKNWPVWLFLFGLLAFAFFGLRQLLKTSNVAIDAVRHGKPFLYTGGKPEAADHVDPFSEHDAVSHEDQARSRIQLTEAQVAAAKKGLDAFERCGLLVPGEIGLADLLQCAEPDEQGNFELYELVGTLCDYRLNPDTRFTKLVFFDNHSEFFDNHAIEIVETFARLSDQQSDVQDIELDVGALISGGSDRKAEISFKLRGEQQKLPFIMHSKSLPAELMQALGGIFARDGDERRFVFGVFDDLWMLLFVTNDQLRALVEEFGDDPPWIDRLT